MHVVQCIVVSFQRTRLVVGWWSKKNLKKKMRRNFQFSLNSHRENMLSCPRKYKYFQGWLVFFMKNKFIKIAQAFTGSIHLPIFFYPTLKWNQSRRVPTCFFMKNKFIKIFQAFTGSIHVPIFLSNIKVDLEPHGGQLLFWLMTIVDNFRNEFDLVQTYDNNR